MYVRIMPLIKKGKEEQVTKVLPEQHMWHCKSCRLFGQPDMARLTKTRGLTYERLLRN